MPGGKQPASLGLGAGGRRRLCLRGLRAGQGPVTDVGTPLPQCAARAPPVPHQSGLFDVLQLLK